MNQLQATAGSAVLGLLLATGTTGAETPDPALQAVVAGEHRSAENRARDAHRHPAETLAFFGLEPDMTVVEIWPGGGWYTEIIAPYVRGKGAYYAAHWDPEAEQEFIRNAVQRFRDK